LGTKYEKRELKKGKYESKGNNKVKWNVKEKLAANVTRIGKNGE
jgi:hypothetical protein